MKVRISSWEAFWNESLFRILRNWRIGNAARRDAKRGRMRDLAPLAGRYVEADVPWDDVNNPVHRQLASEARADGLAEEETTHKKREEEFAKHVQPWKVMLVFFLLVVLETLGNSLVTRDLGVEGIERWIFALLLSLAVFLLVYLSSENQPKKGFNVWYALTLAALGCIVVAITLMRLTHGTEQLVYVIAEGVIFGTCTIGAAVGSHRVFNVWRSVSPEWRAIKVARRHLKERKGKQAVAKDDIATIKNTSNWRTSKVTHIGNVYTDAWNNAA